MKAITISATIALVAFTVTSARNCDAAPATPPCFSPLNDPSKRVSEDFKDLEAKTTKRKAKEVERFLPIEGSNEVNIDFYYLKFSAPKNVSLETFFKVVRLRFALFAEGERGSYGFDAYGSKYERNDPLYMKNSKVWEQDIPEGALMSFDLGTPLPSWYKKTDLTYRLAQADGDLQVTCATKTDFVFSTVESKRGGAHPVSGKRGFGLKDNGDGTWMFYSKAVDAVTVSKKNWMGQKLGMDILCLGHEFWRQFYGQMSKYLESRGLRVQEYFNGNHGPVPYPFKAGSQPPTKVCPPPGSA